MTSTSLRPATSISAGWGASTRAAKRAAIAAILVAVGLGIAFVSDSLISVLLVAAFAIAITGAAFLWNEPNRLFAIAVYLMWFEALGVGPVNTGRTIAFLAIAIPMARIITSRWRIPAIEPRVWLPIALVVLWCLLTVFWSADVAGFITGFLALFLGVAYAVLFAIFTESPEQMYRLLEGWVVVGVVIGLLSALVHYGLGYRSFGFTGGPNEYALYNVEAFPVCVVLATRSSGWKRLFFWAAIPVFFIGTLAAGSRGGLIGIGMITVFCMVTRPGMPASKRVLAGVASLFVVAAGILLAGILDPERFTLLAFVSDRGAGRLDIWSAGIVGLKEHWLLGYGIGGFARQALALVQRAGGSLEVARQPNFRDQNNIPAHNMYLGVALDLGLVGFVIYFGAVGVAIKNLIDMLRSRWRDIAWIGLGVMVAVLGTGPFGSTINVKMQWAFMGLPGAYFVRRTLTDREVRRARHLDIPAPAAIASSEPTEPLVEPDHVAR